MSETGDFPGGPASNANERLRERRREGTEALLAESLRFVKWDGDINDIVKDMLATVAAEIKRNPTILVAATPGTTTGSAFEGSAEAKFALPNPFRDVIDFIKQIGELAKDEKNFFLKLIFLALCDNACECLCKCICNEQK